MYLLYQNIVTTKVYEIIQKTYPKIFDDTCRIHSSEKIMYVTDKCNRYRMIEELYPTTVHQLLYISFGTFILDRSIYEFCQYTAEKSMLAYKDDSENVNILEISDILNYIDDSYDLMIVDDICIPVREYFIDYVAMCEYGDGQRISVLLLMVDPLAYIEKMREEINKPPASEFFHCLEAKIRRTQKDQIQKYLALKEIIMYDIVFMVMKFWVHIEEAVSFKNNK